MIVRTMITGRGLKAAGRYKRFRDLYCVVEVQLIDYHRKYEHYHHKQPAENMNTIITKKHLNIADNRDRCVSQVDHVQK